MRWRIRVPHTAEDDRACDDPSGRASGKVHVERVDNMFEEGWDLDIEQLIHRRQQ